MTEEEKVTNGRNSRASQQIRKSIIETIVIEKNEPLIKTAEEKLEDVSGNLLRSPDIEPSIFQADIVETTTSTTAPPADAEAASAEAPSSDTEGADDSSTPASDDKPSEEKPAEDTPAGTSETPQEPKPADTTEENPPGETEQKEEGMKTVAEEKSEKPETETKEEGEKMTTDADVDKPTDTGSTTEQTTVEPTTKNPYQIDIRLEKKINKRTQRKLWEEIEKRKPLIPKYVERHIQKYAKPPFELWGCKFRGKGSCYGCG